MSRPPCPLLVADRCRAVAAWCEAREDARLPIVPTPTDGTALCQAAADACAALLSLERAAVPVDLPPCADHRAEAHQLRARLLAHARKRATVVHPHELRALAVDLRRAAAVLVDAAADGVLA